MMEKSSIIKKILIVSVLMTLVMAFSAPFARAQAYYYYPPVEMFYYPVYVPYYAYYPPYPSRAADVLLLPTATTLPTVSTGISTSTLLLSSLLSTSTTSTPTYLSSLYTSTLLPTTTTTSLLPTVSTPTIIPTTAATATALLLAGGGISTSTLTALALLGVI
ncbi:MAG: hypothetical protein ACMUJM_12425 [bacterium]